jgi:hypothetical protein
MLIELHVLATILDGKLNKKPVDRIYQKMLFFEPSHFPHLIKHFYLLQYEKKNNLFSYAFLATP